MATAGPDPNAEREHLHAGRRTLAVLEAIAAQPAGVTPKHLSQTLRLHLSTCYRLLNTLQAAGYVVRANSGLFTLGRRVAYLNQRYEAAVRPPAEVLAFLHALQLATGETAMLLRLEGDEVVIIAFVEGRHPDAHPGAYVGLAGPAYAFAAGRVLLAGLPHARQAAAIAQSQTAPDLPWLPQVSSQALQDEFDAIQHRGYAVDRGTAASSVCCLAAPIRFATGDAMSVAIIAPCTRLRPAEARSLPVLLEVARAIGALGQLPPADPTQLGEAVSQTAIEAAQAAIADAMSRVT